MSKAIVRPFAEYIPTDETRTARVVFGGTFDPPHEGHLSAITRLLQKFSRVILAPTSQNPWKEREPTPLSVRCEMLAALCEWGHVAQAVAPSDPGVWICTHPYVYSADLVVWLREHDPAPIFWAVADDSAASVPSWRNWTPMEVPTLSLPITTDVHSTGVREGRHPAHESVRALIAQHGLYKPHPA